MGHTLPAGNEQTHGIAIFRTQALTVLVKSHKGVVEGLGHGDAGSHRGGIGSFGVEPFSPGTVDSGLVEENGQRHPRPFAARGQAVQMPGPGLERARIPSGVAVAPAFHETQSGHHGITQQIIHHEGQGPRHQTVDQKAVPVGDDGWHPVMVAFKMQTVGGNDTLQVLERGPGYAVAGRGLVAGDPADNFFLMG